MIISPVTRLYVRQAVAKRMPFWLGLAIGLIKTTLRLRHY
jgi:hypothetical protein